MDNNYIQEFKWMSNTLQWARKLMESSASQTDFDILNLLLEDHVEVWPWEFDKETWSYLWRRRTCPRCSRRRHLSLVEGPSRKRWLALDSLAWRHCLLPSKTSGPWKRGNRMWVSNLHFPNFVLYLVYMRIYIKFSQHCRRCTAPQNRGNVVS